MKKCARCGLLNEDSAETCGDCGFITFQAKPGSPPRQELPAPTGSPVVVVERRGNMVTLKCRTPAEAYLIIENLQSVAVIALLPDEKEMARQIKENGYIELAIPASAYDSAGDIRSAVEFSAPPRLESTIGWSGKILALLLGIFIFPGVLFFLGCLSSYEQHNQAVKATELKLWFLTGFIGLMLLIFGIPVLVRLFGV